MYAILQSLTSTQSKQSNFPNNIGSSKQFRAQSFTYIRNLTQANLPSGSVVNCTTELFLDDPDSFVIYATQL